MKQFSDKTVECLARDIASMALINPLTNSLLHTLCPDIEIPNMQVCPYCGSPVFDSGLLRNFEEYAKEGEDGETEIHVCFFCKQRFDEPDEQEDKRYWFIREYWGEKMKKYNEEILAPFQYVGLIWKCPYPDVYSADIWRILAREHLLEEYRKMPQKGWQDMRP